MPTASAAPGLQANASLLDGEREAFRETVRSFFEKRAGTPRPQAPRPPEAERRTLWQEMQATLGIQKLAVPIERGGDGFGLEMLGLVLEEAGRVLHWAPLVSVAVVTAALLRSSSREVCTPYLDGLASGELMGAAAFTRSMIGLDMDAPLKAARSSGAWRVSGRAPLVLHAQDADFFITQALTGEGSHHFLIPAARPSVKRSALNSLDLTRDICAVTFEEADAIDLGQEGSSLPARVLRDVESWALACESAGGAERCLEMAVAYARERVQFGRPIGSFQAIKHKCADMLVRVELGKAAVRRASSLIDREHPGASEAVKVARASCADAFLFCAAEMIHVHGGIGFTWDHPAHLFYKRAGVSGTLDGGPARQLDAVAECLGLVT